MPKAHTPEPLSKGFIMRYLRDTTHSANMFWSHVGLARQGQYSLTSARYIDARDPRLLRGTPDRVFGFSDVPLFEPIDNVLHGSAHAWALGKRHTRSKGPVKDVIATRSRIATSG